jgi:hypothetical protein
MLLHDCFLADQTENPSTASVPWDTPADGTVL